MAEVLEPHREGTLIRVRAVPRARKEGVAGLYGGSIRVQVSAPPVEGKANARLLEVLARTLGVRPRQLELVRGTRGRDKVVLVRGLDPEEVRRRLKL